MIICPESSQINEVKKFLVDAPIFLQPWWLNAVAPGNYEYIVIRRGENIAAVMPLVRRQSVRKLEYAMPKLTQVLGPWIRRSEGSYRRCLSDEMHLLNDIIAEIPKFSTFNQNFHYEIQNWLPFYWEGFNQTTRYTYVLEDLSNLENIWKGFSQPLPDKNFEFDLI